MEKLLYGAAYYDEYMPCERLEKDVDMMKKAGVNVVRIAESTWSTCEPQEGVFDFSHVERVLDAMEEAGIGVIIGTPTYAVPTWMVKSYPDVLATTKKGKGIYGARQIMDITNPAYLFYSERVIRKLMECTAHRKCVIGFQVDNETKYYGTAGNNVQEQFVKYLREKFHDNLDDLNAEFGLDYWSNRINAWEDFPDVRGTINASLGGEFEKFQRTLVDRFLSWQAGIVNEYRREDQFITHNFDFDWKGFSYGVQSEVNHFHAAKAVTIAGTDIYHPSQDALTGKEIAFGGDLIRSVKQDNYLVLETEAQGFPQWVPYKGQLRLQAFSHLASGANSVMYWHWHSLHNAIETYWKGLLSHDFAENATYKEACTIGADFARLSTHLVNLKKKNQVAILVSNESLTALKWFAMANGMLPDGSGVCTYNDVVRWMYDTLFEMNIECDFVCPETTDFNRYSVLIVPALYAAEDALLERLNEYVKQGGTLAASFKSAFANENIKVSHEVQPHILKNCLGVSYHQFTFPANVHLAGPIVKEEGAADAQCFMELLIPDSAEVLASYVHPNWGEYAAITKNAFGTGHAYYLGTMTSKDLLKEIYRDIMLTAGVEIPELTSKEAVIRKGTNEAGKLIRYYLNYSPEETSAIYSGKEGIELLEAVEINQGDSIKLEPWGVKIIEEA